MVFKKRKVNKVQNVGPHFRENLFEDARLKAWKFLNFLSSQVEEGMTEKDLQEVCEAEMQRTSIEKWWHPIKIRFSQNTTKSFREPSLEGIRIQEGDLFFIDLGPVFFNHEADVGQTFCLGDPDFKNPAEEVFHELKVLWEQQGLKGTELYERACDLAKERGLIFNLKMGGHRLSDFPHALHHKGQLKDFDTTPQKKRWILEVHLIDEDQKEGYFFEDLL